ncbi:MAG: hypothetical protein H6604_06395 [Flavobacteriales bacterium]|nr:hypothetical protein [Flavobacteriales bacterium]
MITKEALKNQLHDFPSQFTIDELVERLIFIEKLELRIEESKKGKKIDEKDLLKEVDKWSK